MFSWITPDWLKGLYEIVATTLRLVYDVLKRLWHIIALSCAALVAFWNQVVSIIAWLCVQFEVVTSMLTSSATAANAAQTAGWPPQVYGAVSWLNYYAPVAEMVAMVSSLVTAWVICSIVRMIKSCIPTVSGG